MESKDVIKGTEYDYHTDSIFTVPECPHCHYSLTVEEDDIGKDSACPYCNKMVRVPDVPWIRKYIDDNHGTKVVDQKCFFCGKMYKVTRHKFNGRWYNAGGRCSCGSSFIV